MENWFTLDQIDTDTHIISECLLGYIRLFSKETNYENLYFYVSRVCTF